jgi:glyoxylase-like metal-dependent hydrolase (beta-lactamase superfamily II)
MNTPQQHLDSLHATPNWQHETAVALLPQVLRLTAGNPSVMTGPGTNTYLVGAAATGWLVIDPGPLDDAHTQGLWQCTQGNIQAIVCTHSHSDHSPGARPLQTLCTQHSGMTPPILGLRSAPTANSASQFTPDRELADGERLSVSMGDAQPPLVLEVMHTPGHAANHLCLLLRLPQAGLLFSGDHILNGSTTVINPPDGQMSAYLRSLDLLDQACQRLGVDDILPAHGHVLPQARRAIAKLKAHRLQREDKVRQAIQAQPLGQLDDWLPMAYDDVPPALWPLARRSLLAHVERLQELGECRTPDHKFM